MLLLVVVVVAADGVEVEAQSWRLKRCGLHFRGLLVDVDCALQGKAWIHRWRFRAPVGAEAELSDSFVRQDVLDPVLSLEID